MITLKKTRMGQNMVEQKVCQREDITQLNPEKGQVLLVGLYKKISLNNYIVTPAHDSFHGHSC